MSEYRNALHASAPARDRRLCDFFLCAVRIVEVAVSPGAVPLGNFKGAMWRVEPFGDRVLLHIDVKFYTFLNFVSWPCLIIN